MTMKNLLIIASLFMIFAISGCASNSAPPATPTPTLAPDKGQIIGILQVRGGDSVKAVSNVNLYLGGTVKDSTGKDSYVGFDRLNDLRAIPDDNGHFAFYNITPGNYGLIFDNGFNAYFLNKPDSEEGLLVSVVPGKAVDLGILLYDSLPLLSTPKPNSYP
jgi:hypothetical protein